MSYNVRSVILMKKIPLTKGMFALVDDEDYESVSRYKWYAYQKASGTWYAERTETKDDGSKKGIPMHRFIMDVPPGLQVDHVDRDGLNNQRTNLRCASHRQNSQNRKVKNKSEKSSRYHGVNWVAEFHRWQAVICAGENDSHGRARQIYIGRFHSEEEAARAYDISALKYFGAFAATNFPREEYEGKKLEVIRPQRVILKGINNPRAKLSESDVLRIRDLAANGHKQASLAREYRVDKALIGRIVHRQVWTHI